MTFPYARLAQKWLGSPLMIEPGKALMIAQAFGSRVTGSDVHLPDFEAGILRDRLRDRYDPHEVLPRTETGVAIIEVEGTLVDKGAYIGQSSGETSYEGLAAQIAEARTSNSVRAVAIEVDSPGGLVDGCFELADEVFELSQVKPTAAFLTSEASSAAYLIASAAEIIYIPELGRAGSIGVMAMYVNAQKWAETEGLDVHVFRHGEKKADGHPFVEPRDGWFDEMDDSLSFVGEVFADRVATYRKGRLTKDSVLALQAGVLRGQKAVDAGLVDEVKAPRAAFAEFAAKYG